jgi:hypothetical protein
VHEVFRNLLVHSSGAGILRAFPTNFTHKKNPKSTNTCSKSASRLAKFIGYVRDAASDLRIVLHHSSLPFTPTAG